MGKVLVGWCVPRAGAWGFMGVVFPPGAHTSGGPIWVAFSAPQLPAQDMDGCSKPRWYRCPWLGPSLHPSSSFQGTGHMETREAGPEAYGGPVWLGTAVTFQRPAGPEGWGGCNTALWPWPWREHRAGIRDVPGSPGVILQVPHLSGSPASHVGPGHQETSLITASRINFHS